ncbi:small ribosomal subunit protein mS33 [Trichomonascus vanleenenianus]|uniref:mitochondrial 37S ribosomal protein mS33 RSM27 n=1 Tax=Trichomonascus vanleenenianus TaxID=2268995 RepID=UPI003ECAC562
MSAPSKARLTEVLKLSKSIFRTTFNPTQARTGAKILRQNLKGETVRNYYKPNVLTLKYLRQIDPEPNHFDYDEERRLEKIAARRKKGKGKPTKAKSKSTDPKKKKK